MGMNTTQINTLAASFSGIKTCTPANFAKIKATLAKLDVEALTSIRNAKIPFVSTAANSLLVDRRSLPTTARLDWAAEMIASKAATAAA